MHRLFGLIGKSLDHSFSPAYFKKKFDRESIKDASYQAFPLDDIGAFKKLVNTYSFSGMNVTIPYKETVIPYLDKIDDTAREIGAVNTIQFSDGKMVGYNTDCIGFDALLTPLLRPIHTHALLLGTGGAAKAVEYVLRQKNIAILPVSRSKRSHTIEYKDIDQAMLKTYTLIINTTPLGMYPAVHEKPNVPYSFLHEDHVLIDLIYNPGTTAFLEEGQRRRATIQNGRKMLEVQAEESWKIWTAIE